MGQFVKDLHLRLWSQSGTMAMNTEHLGVVPLLEGPPPKQRGGASSWFPSKFLNSACKPHSP